MNKALQTMEWMTPGANLNAYIQGTATVPILSLDEEKSLGEALYYEDDLDAARKLVMSHLRFVVHIARSYNGYGLPLADLIQEGNVGLMKAVRRFNPEKGVRVVSFAVHWIKAEIHEFILRNWRIVKIATTKSQRKLFFNLRSAKKELQWLSADEAKAVAEDLGVEVKDVMEMEMRLTSGMRRLMLRQMTTKTALPIHHHCTSNLRVQIRQSLSKTMILKMIIIPVSQRP